MRQTPNPPGFVQAVHDYLAHAREQFNYDQLVHTFTDNERFYRWATVVDRLHPVRGARFLSSGCGFGGSVVAYRDVGAAWAVGIEVDPDYVRIARLRVADLAGAEIRAYQGARLPFDDATFDIIESMDVLEHVTDPDGYLRELLRVLAPGGLILLVTPNRLWPVEQHLGIIGPPWLPVPVADASFGLLSRVPVFRQDRRYRYSKLRGMRAHNLSLRRLRAFARKLDLHLRLLRPGPEDTDWPLPRAQPLVERMLDHRIARFLAPARTLAVTLERRRDRTGS